MKACTVPTHAFHVAKEYVLGVVRDHPEVTSGKHLCPVCKRGALLFNYNRQTAAVTCFCTTPGCVTGRDKYTS